MSAIEDDDVEIAIENARDDILAELRAINSHLGTIAGGLAFLAFVVCVCASKYLFGGA